jgi:lysophospholipase L1-like esterase
VPPVSREYDVAFGDGNFNKRIVELNLRIRNYCEGLDCYYFDLHDHLSTQHTNGSFYLSKDLTSDGIHLNEKGYKLWIKALRIELLKSRLK